MKAYKTVHHNGAKETLYALSSVFWITKCKNYMKCIISGCLVCKRMEGQCYGYPVTPTLSSFRVSKDFAFTYTGIDHAGPLYVRNIYQDKQKKQVFKCWIILFTCANSRAMSARFISSRGAPKMIISDNGSAFCSSRFCCNKKYSMEF